MTTGGEHEPTLAADTLAHSRGHREDVVHALRKQGMPEDERSPGVSFLARVRRVVERVAATEFGRKVAHTADVKGADEVTSGGKILAEITLAPVACATGRIEQ
jgi:hypothetical protein